MAEDTDPDTQDVEWVSLKEAFVKIGRKKFDVGWEKGTIYLSPGAYRLKFSDEALPVRIDYSIKYTHPEEWGEHLNSLADENVASEEMIRHYDETKELLLGAIWEGKINVEAIASDGELSVVPRKAWKDATKAFEISFPDSEVCRFKPEGSGETWSIRIDSNGLQGLLQSVEAERKKAVRRKAAQKNPNKGGAPFKYDWPYIKLCISEEMRNSAEGLPGSEIARRVVKRLEDEGIEPPTLGQLRGKVKEVREAG